MVSLVTSKSGKWILEIPSNLYILAKIDDPDGNPGLVAMEYSEYFLKTVQETNTKLYNYSCVGHLTIDKNLDKDQDLDGSDQDLDGSDQDLDGSDQDLDGSDQDLIFQRFLQKDWVPYHWFCRMFLHSKIVYNSFQ